ncbi:hypothetical protein DENIS_2916 [Desulfonema ishimotonii]|uniref:Uncharacterized protein n=2 Tax=Desulfonema ishimotonii TaxID=45657 RepID=A0A401FYC9_9BACT|nr:hypothetical protein DENIS_2916 [Desulfonema ishimotonii]
MNNSITIQELSESVRNIDTRRFIAQTDRYVRAAAALDRSVADPEQAAEKRRAICDTYYQNIMAEASEIVSGSTLSVSRLINFRLTLNGQAGRVPETDRLTESYFRRLRKHQVELLSVIADDIEIIRAIIRQSREMQDVLGEHARSVQAASVLMGIMRERVVRRPTTLLQLQGSGKKIRQLNETFQNIQTYENDREREIREDSENNPVSNALNRYIDCAQGAYADIGVRGLRIRKNGAELKKGGKLLVKLATKGYSRFMKKSLDLLLEQHERRVRQFQEEIRQYRQTYYIETGS